MKNLICIVALGLTVACNERTIYQPKQETVIEKEVPVPFEKEHEAVFAGYYNLDGEGNNCIYLDEKAPNVVDIESDCQSLTTLNPQNDTIGQFPRISGTNYLVTKGAVRFTRDLNYTSGHDIEEDVSGANILGKRRTDVVIEVVDNRMRLTISVYSNSNNNNLNWIVAKRVFNEL